MQLTLHEFKTYTSGLPAHQQKEIFSRTIVIVKSPRVERCEFCGQIPLMQWRRSKKYCDNACKQKAWRQRKERKDGKQ